MTITFPYSSAPVRQIREIQFGVMSPEEIVSGRLPLLSPPVLAQTKPFCICSLAIVEMDGMEWLRDADGGHGDTRLVFDEHAPANTRRKRTLWLRSNIPK